MNQHSNMYSGQVQQHGQSSYYSNTQSASSAMQQVTQMQTEHSLAATFSPLDLYSVLVCLRPSPGDRPPAQLPALLAKLRLWRRPAAPGAAPDSSAGPAPHTQSAAPRVPTIQGHHGPQPQHDAAAHQQGTVKCIRVMVVGRALFFVFFSALTPDLFGFADVTRQMDMDLKLFGSGMDVKPGTPPVSGRSTTPTSSPYRYRAQAPRVTQATATFQQ